MKINLRKMELDSWNSMITISSYTDLANVMKILVDSDEFIIDKLYIPLIGKYDNGLGFYGFENENGSFFFGVKVRYFEDSYISSLVLLKLNRDNDLSMAVAQIISNAVVAFTGIEGLIHGSITKNNLLNEDSQQKYDDTVLFYFDEILELPIECKSNDGYIEFDDKVLIEKGISLEFNVTEESKEDASESDSDFALIDDNIADALYWINEDGYYDTYYYEANKQIGEILAHYEPYMNGLEYGFQEEPINRGKAVFFDSYGNRQLKELEVVPTPDGEGLRVQIKGFVEQSIFENNLEYELDDEDDELDDYDESNDEDDQMLYDKVSLIDDAISKALYWINNNGYLDLPINTDTFIENIFSHYEPYMNGLEFVDMVTEGNALYFDSNGNRQLKELEVIDTPSGGKRVQVKGFIYEDSKEDKYNIEPYITDDKSLLEFKENDYDPFEKYDFIDDSVERSVENSKIMIDDDIADACYWINEDGYFDIFGQNRINISKVLKVFNDWMNGEVFGNADDDRSQGEPVTFGWGLTSDNDGNRVIRSLRVIRVNGGKRIIIVK